MIKMQLMDKYESLAQVAIADGYGVIEDGYDLLVMKHHYQLSWPEMIKVLKYIPVYIPAAGKSGRKESV